MQPSVPLQPDSLQLDALIAKLKDNGESELLIEHLQTAHAYLHGAMPRECAHNLELAHGASGAVTDKALEGEVKNAITDLLDGLHPSVAMHLRHRWRSEQVSQPATAKGLGKFFGGADLSLGIFYPKKHVVAVFSSFHHAEAARDVLSHAGFRLWEVIAVPGHQVDEFLVDLREHHSLWAELMVQFSRLLDTEAPLVDHYGQWARRGSGFLVAYSPTQAQAEEIFELLMPLHPMAMHWFMPGYIRHLM
jgi:hypothetical protein